MPLEVFVSYDLDLRDFDGKRVVREIKGVKADVLPRVGDHIFYGQLSFKESHHYIVSKVSHSINESKGEARCLNYSVIATADPFMKEVVEARREQPEIDA